MTRAVLYARLGSLTQEVEDDMVQLLGPRQKALNAIENWTLREKKKTGQGFKELER